MSMSTRSYGIHRVTSFGENSSSHSLIDIVVLRQQDGEATAGFLHEVPGHECVGGDARNRRAQHARKSADQLFAGHGLGQVCLDADFATPLTVPATARCREHHDAGAAKGGIALHGPGHFEAVATGDPHVKDHYRNRVSAPGGLLQRLHGLLDTVGLVDDHAHRLELAPDEHPAARVVVQH
jgi:hypothetical protein